MFRITVVTVTYNAEKLIENTLKSVLIQDYPNLEYVIVDGGSKDLTVRIIQEYEKHFLAKNVRYSYISEKDNGIFDAMNKAAKIASGDYVIFINAGDLLANASVISSIFGSLSEQEADVIYGNHHVLYEKMFTDVKPQCLDSMTLTMPFSHQATFTKREKLLKNPYNTTYSLCADYDLYLKLYLSKAKFVYVDCFIAYFAAGGACQSNIRKTRNQVFSIRRSQGVINNTNYVYHWIRKEIYIYKCLVKSLLNKNKACGTEHMSYDYLN